MDNMNSPAFPTKLSFYIPNPTADELEADLLSKAVEALEVANLGLYELVIDYLTAHSLSANAELIQKLLYDWVVKTDFTVEKTRKDLHLAFRLISFLNELAEKAYEVEFLINLVKEKKEVNYV